MSPLHLQVAPCTTVFCLLVSAILAASTQAQQAPTPAQSPASTMTNQELAVSVHNPFQDFVKVPIQSTTGFQLGRDRKVGDAVNVEPLRF